MVPGGSIALLRAALHGDIEDRAWSASAGFLDDCDAGRSVQGARWALVGRHPNRAIE